MSSELSSATESSIANEIALDAYPSRADAIEAGERTMIARVRHAARNWITVLEDYDQ